jgi:hypothetical protein
MLILLWLALLLLGICAVLLLPFWLGREFYKSYSAPRVVNCPHSGEQVAVGFDTMRAALTQLAGSPSLRLSSCTRWPEHADCDQGCIPSASRSGPYTEGEVSPSKAKSIYQVPVFVAAFLAWAIGAVWHSHYLFRARWMQAAGLSRPEVHQLVWKLGPHLVTIAAPLLFAYGVAWVLFWLGKQDLLRGALVGMLMWSVFVLAVLLTTSLSGLSQEFLKLELGYTAIAAAVIGMTIGELNSKLHARNPAH